MKSKTDLASAPIVVIESRVHNEDVAGHVDLSPLSLDLPMTYEPLMMPLDEYERLCAAPAVPGSWRDVR
jgi:hypothetical protein